jgi:DNA-3-methyladenine glycosylase II
VTDPHETLGDDPDLGPIVDEHGPIPVQPADDFFERFVTSIIRQQVSMASAAAIRERLFEAVEVSPAGILAAEESVLEDAGLSNAKVRYVNNVATAFTECGYDRDYFAGLSNDEVRAELTEISGVGPWTANMQLIFSLGRADVFPVGDLALRKAMHRIVDPELSRSEMATYASRWAPYRSYATRYLWRATDDQVPEE